jgi:hypothetical protein
MKPTPFQLFCGYYLGLDKDLRYRFFNQASLASHYGVDSRELREAMEEYRLTPEDTRHVDYNLARAHATAQDLVESAGADEVKAFAARTFEEFRAAMGGYDATRDFENVDYDRILSDDDPGPDGGPGG